MTDMSKPLAIELEATAFDDGDTTFMKIEDTIFDALGTLKEFDARRVAKVVAAVGEVIHDLGTVPSGHLYAILLLSGVTLSSYYACLTLLRRARFIEESGHVLTWVGF